MRPFGPGSISDLEDRNFAADSIILKPHLPLNRGNWVDSLVYHARIEAIHLISWLLLEMLNFGSHFLTFRESRLPSDKYLSKRH